ncbi:MAG TPA: UV DNA damage repair endonuclease UvsE [Methanoregulaceae archaeon]|nr:UV DNA damage repair endonuclease UvsE [Methanoregulaceae archaeon]
MKIGYPCINTSIHCRGNRTFRLASYSPERFAEVTRGNLLCLQQILSFNVAHGIFFFRISSDLVPFASHPVLDVQWQEVFARQMAEIGDYIKRNDIRISMHPDQFVVINSLRQDVVERSIQELRYHAEVLECMGLGPEAKIQIHVGGVYGNRDEAKKRFIKIYNNGLDQKTQKHLAIENDERSYRIKDCLEIRELTGIPVIIDTFHHSLNNSGETEKEAITAAAATWERHDGLPMADYSSQKPGQRPGTHANSIDIDNFGSFIRNVGDLDLDIMLEIKDKERSALRTLEYLSSDPRLIQGR